MIVFGVSTTVEQDERHSEIIFRRSTSRLFAGLARRSRSTELHVSSEGLTATGDLGGYKSATLHLGWNALRELHFAPGGRGEIGGLYARQGHHCSRCILPRITEAQAHQVIAAIAHRFPSLLRTTETELECAVLLPPPPYRTSAESLRLLPPGPTL